MQESFTPISVEVDADRNLTHLITDWVAQDPQDVAFRIRKGAGWQDVTISQFHQQVLGVAKGLVAAGINPGDRVALMSRTRYEWTLADAAIWFAGAITVPVYETSSAEQVEWILSDSGAVAAFVEHDRSQIPQLDQCWTLTEGLAELVDLGRDVSDQEIETRCAALQLDSPATLIYTSGTTGRPKGCVLTHGNFYVLSVNTVARLGEVVAIPTASTLLFLPLAHVFARFISTLALAARCPIGHTSDVKDVVADLATFQPTYILAVPRIFEKIYNSAEQTAQADGRVKIYHRAAEIAIAYSRALDSGGAALSLRIQHAVFDRLVYSRLRTRLGGKLQYAVSGGGPLGERLGHFYRGLGLTVLEGYGLTESTAPTCVNVPERVKIGTVGAQLPGNSVRIAEDQEILLKGPHIFTEYWNNPEATADAFTDDGWFQTGDFGSLDEDGYLKIVGRKKEILVTAAGKNVVPSVLEDRLRASPLVSQCIVVGDNKPFIGALVTLDEEMLPTWAANHGLPEMTIAEAARNPQVIAAVQQGVDRANQAVSRAESIRKFEILETDFTVESGHLTPSLKLKRNIVMKDFRDDVERLYG